MYALRQNIDLFYSPTELHAANILPQQQIRRGGMVRHDSIQHTNNLKVTFVVTDFKDDVIVHYTGILPDLFKEGQGVVASGSLNADNIFVADQILAKHDQNYMPR